MDSNTLKISIKTILYCIVPLSSISFGGLIAMDQKQRAEPQTAAAPYSTSYRDLDIKGMRERTSNTQRDIKSNNEAGTTIAPLFLGKKPAKMPFDLIEPIPQLLPLTMAPSEKIKHFESLAQKPVKNTRELYRLLHDPTIKSHIKYEKTVRELQLHSIVDAQNLTILDHSIKNNDAPMAALLSTHMNELQRQKAIRSAAQNEMPRIVLALLPERFASHAAHALDRFFLGLPDLTSAEIDCYFSARHMLEDHARHRSTYYAKVLSGKRVNAKVGAPLNSLIDDAQECIGNYLQPKPTQMNPVLEKAIEDGDHIAVRDLLDSSCSASTPNAQGMDALTLAAYHGHPAMFRMIMGKVPYIDTQDREKTLAIVDKRLHELQSSMLDLKVIAERKKQFEEIKTIITVELPKHIAEKNEQLRQACIDQNVRDVLAALGSGADPNGKVTHENQEVSIAWQALNIDNSIFLKIFLIYGFNPNTTHRDPDTGRDHPFTFWACDLEKHSHLKLLIDYGANTMSVDGFNMDLVYFAYKIASPQLLEIILDRNPKLADAMIASNSTGKKYPLIMWAMHGRQIAHFQLLLNRGANPNALASDGTHCAWTALCILDPIYLNLLLIKGADPNTIIRHSNGIQFGSLLFLVILNDLPKHAQLLLDASADPNYIESDGRSAALEALKSANPDFLKMMLAAGLNKNTLVKDNDGKQITLLQWARKFKKQAQVKILAAVGAR